MRSDFYGLPATQGTNSWPHPCPTPTTISRWWWWCRMRASSARSNRRWTPTRWGLWCRADQPGGFGCPAPLQGRDRNESKGPSQGPGHDIGLHPGIADFSGMDGTQNLFIWEVMHKAFIDVAEKRHRGRSRHGRGHERRRQRPSDAPTRPHGRPALPLLPARPAHRCHPLHGPRDGSSQN